MLQSCNHHLRPVHPTTGGLGLVDGIAPGGDHTALGRVGLVRVARKDAGASVTTNGAVTKPWIELVVNGFEKTAKWLTSFIPHVP